MDTSIGMNIPQKIEEIVIKRKTNLPLIEAMQQRLLKVDEVVSQLDKICREMAIDDTAKRSSLISQNQEIAEKLRLINIIPFKDQYKKTRSLLEQLHQRFSRSQIHISFVGRAGKGKSLLMQQISGLSGDVIPSSDGSDCTGAKSIITNRAENEVSAQIRFYTRSEYLNIINNYLKVIFGNKYEISSLDEISHLRKIELKKQIDCFNAQGQALYLQLEKYIEHSEEVIPLLGTEKEVNASEIESYVAQYNRDDKDKKYYKYLGVKVANILCSFPCAQCGKIVLVDTIGLGAVALDVKEQMLETVRNDSDAILLMICPTPLRPRLEQEDIDIINAISGSVHKEYTRHMLFCILNKVCSGKGKNSDGIHEVSNQFRQMGTFPVADVLLTDCMNKNEVEKNLLIPILERLSNNIPEMDNILLQDAETKLKELYQEYHLIAERVGQAFSASVDQNVHRHFKTKIDSTYDNMTNSIRDLYQTGTYGKLRNINCEKLKIDVEKKLKSMFSLIPTKERILELLNRGSINQHNAYERLTDEIRLKVIDSFLELNGTMHELALEMKRDIIFCLADREKGRLENLVSSSLEKSDLWLEELIKYLSKYNKYILIKEAMEKLHDFDLRMESFLIYRVRAHLDPIDLSLISNGPQLRGYPDKNTLGDDILFWLKHYLESVHKEIRDELEPLYSYPNSALWAVVKDFYDRIVYARSNTEDVHISWTYLYEDSIPRIWQDDYNDYLKSKGVSEQWNLLTTAIHNYDNKRTFCFVRSSEHGN